MWSEYLAMTCLSFQALRYSSASSRRCRMMLVPRCGAVDGFDLEVARAAADPAHAFFGRQTRAARFHRDLVGHDEARVKAHAELADELGVLLLVAAELAHEVLGATLGNRAQVVDGLLLAHADAVVGDGQRLGGLVEAHAHFQVGGVFKQRGVVEALKPQLVAGIRRIGDQLAQEDFLVGIQRMGDQVQQLGHFGLERQGLLAHGRFLSQSNGSIQIREKGPGTKKPHAPPLRGSLPPGGRFFAWGGPAQKNTPAEPAGVI